MKNKLIIIGLLFIICLFGTIILYVNDLATFSIVLLALDIVLIVSFILTITNNRNSRAKYNSDLKRILKTYSGVLVETSKPALEGKNIIYVTNIVDLVDAQIEMRKPIYYMVEESSCSFVIIDNDVALFYIIKENENVINKYEEYAKSISKDNIIKEENNNIQDNLDQNFQTNIDVQTIETKPINNIVQPKLEPIVTPIQNITDEIK